MIISKLILKNFRVYNDKPTDNSYDFEPKKNKPFSVVIAPSGSGKTTVWEALNWVFFGAEVENELIKKDQDFCLCNWNLIDKSKKITDAEVKVEVQVELHQKDRELLTLDENRLQKSNKFRIIRKMQYSNYPTRKDRGLLGDPHLEILYVDDSGSSDPTVITHGQDFIDSILPKTIRNYYFYDGATEDIQTLAKKEHNVKQATRNLSGLEIVDTLLKLTKIYQEKKSMPKEASTKKIKELEDKRDTLNEIIEQRSEKRDNARNTIKELEDDMEGIKSEVEKEKKGKEVIEKLNGINDVLNEMHKRFKEAEKQKKDYFDKNAFHILNAENYKNLHKSINKEIKIGKWPKNITEGQIELLENALNEPSGKSIIRHSCQEANIKEGAGLKFFKSILSQIKQEVKEESATGKDVSRLNYEAETQYKKTDQIKSKLKDYDEKVMTISHQIGAKEKERDKIIKEHDLPDDLENYKQTYTEQYKALFGKKVAEEKELEIQIDAIKRARLKLDEINKNLTKELQKQSAGSIEAKRRKLLIDLETKLNTKTKEFEDINRKKIGKELNSIYTDFWKEHGIIDKVVLNDDYSIEVFDSNDQKMSLSKGQSITLSVAFILGIVKACGINTLPLVIDAPTSQVDDDLGKELLSVLKENCEQIILLVLPGREYHDNETEEKKYIDTHKSHGYFIKKTASAGQKRISKQVGNESHKQFIAKGH